ncbi:MAG: hypothetical protein U5L07_12345 [Desulfobacterales bacterium]|nr:hypothetical protein [Desulfobacterales bacterium]
MRVERVKVMALILGFMFFAATCWADDITDSIKEALDYYKEGAYTDAVGSLNYASQLIQQKKGEELESMLPEPLDGWTARDASSQAVGAAMMGGGLSAERSYSKEDSTVDIKIITDSPIMQGMMMMFSNPMLAASDGGKMQKIGRQKAIVKYDTQNKSGDINVVVANRFLVTIEGRDVSEADLKAYAKAIDYNKLSAMP